jgi:hypothetical protein
MDLEPHEVRRRLSLRLDQARSRGCGGPDLALVRKLFRRKLHFMKTLVLIFTALLSLSVAAHAQIGWTLEQCRERIGPEFQAANGDTHYFHVGPWGRGLGEHIYISFDPDDTVGTIQWLKLDGEAFSEAEIQERLREASHVTWQRRNDHDTGELNWIGVQNRKVIFDANEADNGRGTYILTISTR